MDDDVDDCDSAADHDEALEAMLGDKEIGIDSGDVCFCDSNNCNDMTSTETGNDMTSTETGDDKTSTETGE